MFDIPDTINYIIDVTKVKSLSYVGFSQGTAQAFAALSLHPSVNEVVDVFIALAPAMSPKGMAEVTLWESGYNRTIQVSPTQSLTP
jgi:lysosomal acid lipase/cholesteryl ester hydrolase